MTGTAKLMIEAGDLRAIQIETLEHALRLAEERTAFWQGQYRKLNEWCTRTATKQIEP